MDATSLRQERDTYGNEKQTINGILGATSSQGVSTGFILVGLRAQNS